MRLHFGLAIQDGTLPPYQAVTIGEAYFGPRQLLHWLEQHLGLSVPEEDIEHLRIEQYRQALRVYLIDHPEAFFAASFLADDLGTAAALLARRDELLMAGWGFDGNSVKTARLQTLAALEACFADKDNSLRLFPGLADRLEAVLQNVGRIPAFISSLHLCDERELYPPIWQRLFTALAKEGLKIASAPAFQEADQDTDLGKWQAFLLGQTPKRPELKGDGSLLLIRSFRDTHLAAYLAQMLRDNTSFRPSILLPKANRTLDNALWMEGLPSLGVPSASLARPSLQVLKLAPAFLWEPIDLYKIMEFVSLAVKPLEEGLAQRIAAFIADTPGLFSGRWHGMIRDYFENNLPQRIKYIDGLNEEAVRKEYNFWFNRKRADSRREEIPKAEVRAIYAYLQEWANTLGREDGSPSLLVLAAQARRIVELLEALPEESLGYLELERIVRTIYEPAPLQYRAAEADRLAFVHQAGAVVGPVGDMLWWDFFEQEPNYFFSRWYPKERTDLEALGVLLEGPDQQNDRLLTQRRRPVLWAQKRLILCQPDFAEGQAVQAHPLMGDLMAAFGEDLGAISLHIDKPGAENAWNHNFNLPKFVAVPPLPLETPQPFLKVAKNLTGREEETPTSLESLLYYPYQWVFRHHIKLHQSGILSVVQDNRLLGNLAHRLLEKMLAQSFQQWSKAELENWITEEIPLLLQREGATLLMYGREPERIAFTKQMKFAAWSLVNLLRQNNWEVLATEQELKGKIGPLPLKGRADLVLQRADEKAIIDLKWRGLSRYSNLLSSGEDVQLALYARLLSTDEQWAHTAYYIIEKGRLLVRNTQAFSDLQPVQDEVDHKEVYDSLLSRILSTYDWRLKQLAQGQVEVRCELTQLELEEHYGEALMDVLEMKTGNAFFDDYDVLIGLVQ